MRWMRPPEPSSLRVSLAIASPNASCGRTATRGGNPMSERYNDPSAASVTTMAAVPTIFLLLMNSRCDHKVRLEILIPPTRTQDSDPLAEVTSEVLHCREPWAPILTDLICRSHPAET